MMTAGRGAFPAVDPFIAFLLEEFTRPNGIALDVGCGPAPYRDFVRGTYVGVDVTDDEYGPGFPSAARVVALSDRLPFRAESFDLVLSKSAFYQFPAPDSALQEFRRVLKPSGRLLLIDYNRRTQKYLQVGEGIARPRWTQWRLRRLVARAGFRNCELFVAKAGAFPWIERKLRLLLQEFTGIWAIVGADK